MIEISNSKSHFIPYNLEYLGKDGILKSVDAKFGLCNAAGYSQFKLYI